MTVKVYLPSSEFSSLGTSKKSSSNFWATFYLLLDHVILSSLILILSLDSRFLTTCFPRGHCQDMIRPVNGNMKGNCKDAKIGDSCSFSCLEGYRLRGSKSITCLSSGSWDDYTPRCDGPIKCKDIYAPRSGSTSGFCSPGYAGLVCSFQCRPGFKLEGPSGIVCLPESGSWNKNPPKCIETQRSLCPDLIYRHADGGVFMGICSPGREGSSCSLKCAEGYVIEGHETYRCNWDGKWYPTPVASSCILNNTRI